ncbi:hypothetical protein RI129_003422 [Pyrocoelia pectoralis]|uniref:Succinate dehydrogenase [ubiquinone] cytochrome b small subunit n=1 Tax=Pyrocoelia pectoralis TaxID=417401 RepID=A0AAN7ZIM2_9COLE
MALSIALRHVNILQGHSSLTKCLSPFYKNLTSLSVSTPTSNRNIPILYSNNLSTLPAVRFLTTPTKILSTVNTSSTTLLNVRSMSHDHRGLWKIEKGISVLLLGLLPACVAFPNEIVDNLVAILTVAHLHWGMESIAQDYARPLVVGPIISKVALYTVYVLTVTTLGGLLFFNYTDIGIGKFVRAFWSLKG